MNIEIHYKKEGENPVVLDISMHNNIDIFYKSTYTIDKNCGMVKFYCDWPFGTFCYADFSSRDPEVIVNYITITRFVFDDFWSSPDLVHNGMNCPADPSSTLASTDSSDFNSIFYVGTLRYTIPPRPLLNWTTKR